MSDDHNASESLPALLDRVLDGQASPEDMARFEEAMASSQAFRDLHRAQAGLLEDLNGLALPEPPPELKAGVMAALAVRKPARRARVSRLVLGFAWAAAAVVLLTLVIRQGSPAQGLSSATMAPQGAAGWPLVNRTAVPEGALTIRRMGDRYVFYLEAAGKGAPSLRWDPAQWEPIATGGNPVELRLRGTGAVVGLWVEGRELARVPVAPAP